MQNQVHSEAEGVTQGRGAEEEEPQNHEIYNSTEAAASPRVLSWDSDLLYRPLCPLQTQGLRPAQDNIESLREREHFMGCQLPSRECVAVSLQEGYAGTLKVYRL